jgi:hypothetical protein
VELKVYVSYLLKHSYYSLAYDIQKPLDLEKNSEGKPKPNKEFLLIIHRKLST